MKPRHRRMLFVVVAIISVGVAAMLINKALNQNISYFYSPSEVKEGKAPSEHVFRLGGMVKEGSVRRVGDGLTVEFVVCANAEDFKVNYTGILPDLFTEGQGVVTKGRLHNENLFIAEEVLAKHDENYMPPEVAATLKPVKKKGSELTSESYGQAKQKQTETIGEGAPF